MSVETGVEGCGVSSVRLWWWYVGDVLCLLVSVGEAG